MTEFREKYTNPTKYIMKQLKLIVLFIALSISSGYAQEACLTENSLKNLDTSWEKAQLNLNFEHINSILAEDFIWVHNHASTIDDKAAVLERINRHTKEKNKDTRSRISKDVKVIIAGKTGIVSGITIVDRGPSPVTYHFMRTYVEISGKCYLLANHTMAIPD